MASNLAQFAFRNVVDNILVPAGVKVGGYPEDMFLNLDDSEQEKYQCNICYLIVKDCKECENNHMFCAACIFAWTMTYGQNSDKCPVCRTPQRIYRDVKAVDRVLGDKKIQCPVEGCRFTGRLQIFLLHLHGRDKYSNADVDFESLRNRHPGPAAAAANSLPPLSTSLVASTHRLRQSRSMLHQLLFMFQWQLELRRRALQAQLHAFDPGQNTSDRLDEALALQVQVDELGAMMGAAMMAVPLSREVREAQDARQGASSSTLRQSGTSLFNPTEYRGNVESDDDDDDDDSSGSDESTIVSARARFRSSSDRTEPVTRVLSSNGSSSVTQSNSTPRRTETDSANRNQSSSSENQRRDSAVPASTSNSTAQASSSQRFPLLNRETMQAPRLQQTTSPRADNSQSNNSVTASIGADAGRNGTHPTPTQPTSSTGSGYLPQVSRPNSVFRSRSRMDTQQNNSITATVAPSNVSPRALAARSHSVQTSHSNERPSGAVNSHETRVQTADDEEEGNLPGAREVSEENGGSRARNGNSVSNARGRRRASRSQSQAPARSNRTTAGRESSVTRPRQTTNDSTRRPLRQINQSTSSHSDANSTPSRPRYNQSHRVPSVASRSNSVARNNDNQTTGNASQATGSSRTTGPTPRQIVRARRRSEIFQELMDQRRQRETE